MKSFEQIDVLLVEDNPFDAEMTLRTLSRQSPASRIEWVKDGAQAIDFIYGQGDFAGRGDAPLPRLILLDLKLPKLTGIEVLRQLKADPAKRHIPVVMLTSSAEIKDVHASYQFGVNSYIVKPMNFDEFEMQVTRAGVYWTQMNQVPS